MCSEIPGLTNSSTFSLLYRASRDGWEWSDFHSKCNDQGKTLTFVKSSKGYLCAGYTALSSKSSGDWQTDGDARLFALTHLKATYKPGDPSKAVYHGNGPNFGGSMQFLHNPMNGENKGNCWTNEASASKYRVAVDKDGNSVLTGDGAGKPDNDKSFTAVEIEVFLIK